MHLENIVQGRRCEAGKKLPPHLCDAIALQTPGSITPEEIDATARCATVEGASWFPQELQHHRPFAHIDPDSGEAIKKTPAGLEFDPETGIPIKKTSSGVEFNPETGEPVFDKSRNKNRRY